MEKQEKTNTRFIPKADSIIHNEMKDEREMKNEGGREGGGRRRE
jgi:hypothetical protein